MRSLSAMLAAALLVAGSATAHDTQQGPLTIDHPWARPAASGNSAAYMVIANSGAGDRLVGAASEVARVVEIHSTSVDAQGVARMVPVQAVDIPQEAEAVLSPGGLHVMLIGLTRPLEVGQTFPLTLEFEQAGPVTVEVAVERSASNGATAGPSSQ